MKRRAFFGRLARGLVALYVAPATLKGLAASSPVEAGRVTEALASLLQEHYLPGIVAQFDASSAMLDLWRGSAEPGECHGDKVMLFESAATTRAAWRGS